MTLRTVLLGKAITGNADADLARAFQGLVTGAEGRAVLGSAGSGSP